MDIQQSALERQNVLNNQFAVDEIIKKLDIKGFVFEGELKFTRKQVAEYLEIEDKTIERYLKSNEKEITSNGYKVYKGKKLKEVKETLSATDIDVPTKTTRLGLFNFRSFLDLAMLLKESDKAKYIRSLILNIVIEVLNERLGKAGDRVFINQKDNNWLDERYMGKIYRNEFTDALRDFVGGGKFKYQKYTDKVYVIIFAEKAQEYKKILKIEKDTPTRDTFYTELITLVASFETGLAHEIKRAFNLKGSYLKHDTVDKIFTDFATHPAWKPQIDSVRRRIVSRDYQFRGVLHDKLGHYLTPIDPEEFMKFLSDLDTKQLRDEKRKQLLTAKIAEESMLSENEFDTLLKGAKE